jgi:hypothetical protein
LTGEYASFIEVNRYLQTAACRERVQKLLDEEGIDRGGPQPVIEALFVMIGRYLEMQVFSQRVERAQSLLSQLKETEERDPGRKALVQKLAEELMSRERPYSIKEFPFLLAFEYISDIALRPEQVEMIKQFLATESEGDWISFIIQVIMGGGKTSVGGAVFARWAAKANRLALFITPSSQYTSVKYNLRHAVAKLGREIEEIDVTREALTLPMCHEIERRLHTAIQKREVVS